MRGFVDAVSFLTIIPLRRGSGEVDRRALLHFPLVGLLLGLLAAGLSLLLAPLVPKLVVAAVVVVFLIAITGGLHWDGFIDSCDALFAPRSPKERLKILKDTSVGAFGLLGGISAFALYLAFLSALPVLTLAKALIVAIVAGRFIMMLAIEFFPYARKEGTGLLFPKQSSFVLFLAATFSSAIAGVVLASAGVVIFIAALVVGLLAGYWAKVRLGGGLTGDVYGALSLVTELTFFALAVPVFGGNL